MPFIPLKNLVKDVASSFDDNGDEQKIDWNDPYQRVKFFYEYSTSHKNKGIDSLVRPDLKIVSVTVDPKDPSVASSVFEYTVPQIFSNAGGNLHGGAVAVIFDFCTSMTVTAVSREDHWDQGHVSRALNCQYIRPAPVGTVLLIESKIVHLGNSMGQLEATMRRKDNGKVCYTCIHDKVQVRSKI